jgi:hypothetical protein
MSTPLQSEHDAADAGGRARRSTRDRPAKPPLSERAIVEAALALTRKEGLEAVTMRRVAAELDTGAASLYVYVDNREELLRAMVERVIGSVPLAAPDPARWREQVYDLMVGVRVELEAHPGLATAFHEPQNTENVLAGAENILGILLAGGISPRDAAWGCDILLLITTASAAEADSRRAAGHTTEADHRDVVAQMHATFTGLPPERFPLLVKHADELLSGFGDERFRFAIETFLDGLVARSSNEREALGRVHDELLAREPIFHRPEHGTQPENYLDMTADDYWEVGASGRVYQREGVVKTLVARGKVQGDEHWSVSDTKVRRLAHDTYAFTYQLDQAGRRTRRITLWREGSSGWKILYHQGTIITDK